MPTDEPRAPRIRSGGRSGAVRNTVARTVLTMLGEGNSTFSVADVALRSGIHRSTVYRWWPNRVTLVQEALTLHTAALTAPDTGDWASDVRALTRELADLFATPVEMALNAIIAADANSEVAQLQQQHWDPLLLELSTIVDRAKARGEVRDDARPPFVLQMIVGPLLLTTTLGPGPSADSTVDAIAEAVSRAFASTLEPLD